MDEPRPTISHETIVEAETDYGLLTMKPTSATHIYVEAPNGVIVHGIPYKFHGHCYLVNKEFKVTIPTDKYYSSTYLARQAISMHRTDKSSNFLETSDSAINKMVNEVERIVNGTFNLEHPQFLEVLLEAEKIDINNQIHRDESEICRLRGEISKVEEVTYAHKQQELTLTRNLEFARANDAVAHLYELHYMQEIAND